jgi:hypothetical protein
VDNASKKNFPTMNLVLKFVLDEAEEEEEEEDDEGK